MSDVPDEGVWRARLARERAARQEAERLLDSKARELYERNLELQQAAATLEARVRDRTTELEAALTEGRRREETLRQAEATLSAALENMQEGIAFFAADGTLRLVNRRAVELLDLPPDSVRSGTPVCDIIALQRRLGHFAEPEAEARAGELERGIFTTGTMRRRQPDGRIIEIRAVRLADGGAVRTYFDVTAEERQQQELAASEERYRLLAENSTDFIVLFDAEGRRLYVSPSLLAWSGRLDVVDGAVADAASLIHPDDRGKAREAFDALVAAGAGQATRVLRWVNAAGVLRWIETRWTVVPSSEGVGIRVLAVSRDVTESKAAEDALRTAEATLSAALENMAQGIIFVAPDGTIRVANSHAAEMTRVPPDLVLPGRQVTQVLEWQIAHGEFGHDPVAEARMRALAADFSPDTGTVQRRRADGSGIEVRTVRLPDGEVIRTFSDITETLRREDELKAARDAAEAAARARGEFLAVMSHEIRTPLNGIIGAAGLLLDTPMLEDQARFAGVVRNSAEHLLHLVNDVLDFTRLESGQFQLEEVGFDLRAEVASVCDLLTQRAAEKGIAVVVSIAEAVPARVIGDLGCLRQVLLNLLDNAVKFTAFGEVTIGVRQEAAGEGLLRMIFEVRDSGIGIDPARSATLFDPFVQADRSISRRYGGTGLGLAICRRIVERMGGTITAEPAPGGGSTFRFDILLHCAEAKVAATAEGPAVAAGTVSLRILLAEDNATNRLVVGAILERAGHRVDAVADGREALDAVATRPYDLVIMDVMMPEMDGLEATRAIRALPGAVGRVPVIGLSAGAQPEDIAACHAAGMNAYEVKPVARQRLLAAIRDVVAASGAAKDGAP